MPKFLFFLTILTLSDLYLFGMGMVDTSGLNEGDRAYMDADVKAVKILQKKYPIKCVGTGVGDNGGIEMLALSFRVVGEVNMAYARDLVIKITNDYVNILNSITSLRPFLKKYPFDEKNVEITLYFYQKNGYEAFHPYLCCASSIKGTLDYHTLDKNNPYGFRDTYRETYEEGLEKIQLKHN